VALNYLHECMYIRTILLRCVYRTRLWPPNFKLSDHIRLNQVRCPYPVYGKHILWPSFMFYKHNSLVCGYTSYIHAYSYGPLLFQ